MFERHSDLAKQAFPLARQEAFRSNSIEIGTEHLLLALLQLSESTAAKALGEWKFDGDRFCATVARDPNANDRGCGDLRQIPLSKEMKVALEKSMEAAMRRGATALGTGDLLLGVLSVPEGGGARALTAQGVDLEALASDLRARLDAQPQGERSPAREPGMAASSAPAAVNAPVGRFVFDRFSDLAMKTFKSISE